MSDSKDSQKGAPKGESGPRREGGARHTGHDGAPRHLHPGRNPEAQKAFGTAIHHENEFQNRSEFPSRDEWSGFFRAAHHAEIPLKESKEFYAKVADKLGHKMKDETKNP